MNLNQLLKLFRLTVVIKTTVNHFAGLTWQYSTNCEILPQWMWYNRSNGEEPMLRLLMMFTLMVTYSVALAFDSHYDPQLLHSYFTHMRQFHAPLFSAMETYCETNSWPTSGKLEKLLDTEFHIPSHRFRSITIAKNTLVMQYQAWPDPEWHATLGPHMSKKNQRPYFDIQLTSDHRRNMIGVDGIAYCQENQHLSDIMLLLREPNDTTPAGMARLLEQRQFAESGKTPHLVASYRG